jgi:hypothetical protein
VFLALARMDGFQSRASSYEYTHALAELALTNDVPQQGNYVMTCEHAHPPAFSQLAFVSDSCSL